MFVIFDSVKNSLNAMVSKSLASDSDSERDVTINKIIEHLHQFEITCEDGVWRHLNELSANDKLKLKCRLGPDVDVLLDEAAEHYFSQKAVRLTELDWLYTDALIAYSNKVMVTKAESIGADIFSGAFAHGLRMLFDKRFGMGLMFIGGKLFTWGLIVAAIFVPLSVAEAESARPYALISLVVMIYLMLKKYKNDSDFMTYKLKTFDRIWAINRAYVLTSSKNIQWEVLAEELKRTRVEGVPWLPSLYTAVKNRVTPKLENMG